MNGIGAPRRPCCFERFAYVGAGRARPSPPCEDDVPTEEARECGRGGGGAAQPSSERGRFLFCCCCFSCALAELPSVAVDADENEPVRRIENTSTGPFCFCCGAGMQTSSSSSSSSHASAQRAKLADAWLLASVVVGVRFFRMIKEFIPEVVIPLFCSRTSRLSPPQVLTDRNCIATHAN